MKLFNNALPPCSGYWNDTPDNRDFDCYANHEETCESCLCNYDLGGLWHPDTGKQYGKLEAFLLYGSMIKHDRYKKNKEAESIGIDRIFREGK